jgi:hypothetical protein
MEMAERDPKRFDPGASPRHRQQRVKNWAMLVLLLGLVGLFFLLSIVRMGGAGS